MSGFDTAAVHAAVCEPPCNEPAAAPIYAAAGWTFRSLDEVDAVYEGRAHGTVYGGSGGPNHELLENLLASLHDAQACVATGSGMSALAVTLFALGSARSRVVASHDVYGNTTRLLGDLERFGVRVEHGDLVDRSSAESLLGQPAQFVIVETISNPRLRVADVAWLARRAHACGAWLVVDNTMATPYHCRPLGLGADVVVESLTKFIGGHHDVVCGAVAGRKELVERIRVLAGRLGVVGSPFEAWLAARSCSTLGLRLGRSSKGALEIARWLQGRREVHKVHYPGLEPARDAASHTLSNGFGSVVSFELAPERAAVNRFVAALRHLKLVLSFGGVATTLSHPATSSHRALTQQQRQALGIHDGFLRLSVGIEEPEDVIADLERGLAALA
jgi:cystathionine beta-lyase/cystathionine gamma-synthase